MVKVQGPMMSFAASGTLADTAVFSSWKGRPYVRNRVVPANPKTDAQTGMRASMSFLSKVWSGLGATPQGTWTAPANTDQISPFNAFVKANQARWRNYQFPQQAYGATEGGTSPTLATMTAQVVGRQVTLTVPVTSQANGWTISFHVSTTNGFTDNYNNCKAITECPSSGSASVTLGPLEPGTYYARYNSGTTTGKKGTASSQITFTIS